MATFLIERIKSSLHDAAVDEIVIWNLKHGYITYGLYSCCLKETGIELEVGQVKKIEIREINDGTKNCGKIDVS